jgi:hypothetical protein
MPLAPLIILEVSAVLIALGGLYDLFIPRLPLNLALICGDNRRASQLVRELLRSLGGALIAVALAVFMLVATSGPSVSILTLILVLALVICAEGVNAFCMYRVGSPYFVPVGIIMLTLVGAYLAWRAPAPVPIP